MKITGLLIIAFCFQVTAKSYGQSVNLTFQNASLKTVIEAFSNQSKLDFVYEDRYMLQANPVTINLKNTSIQSALKAIFSNQPFQYEVEDGIVYIKPKAMAPSDKSQLTVRGKVTDSIGQALQGVVVEVVGTNLKTATDRDGMFTIQNMVPGTRLTFRLLGYESQTVSVNSSEINITLSQVVSQLDEVVVSKGYYNVTKELNTGSVSSVKAEILQRQPVSDPLLALSGRVPGLYIQQNSGVPGNAPTFNLRGQNSIANGNDPLFVIDGIPFTSKIPSGMIPVGAAGNISPFASIPINTIESIEVLKDADATAIYGSRGANGVILINTKKGSSSKTELVLDYNRGLGKVANRLHLMDTKDYLDLRRQAFNNDGLSFRTTDYDVNGTWDETRYTDWQKVMIGGTSQLTDASLGVIGGTGRSQFSLMTTYRNESTVFPGAQRNRQLGMHLGLNHESKDQRFRLSFVMLLSNLNLSLPLDDFTSYIILAPNAPNIRNTDGSLNWENSTWSNPFRQLVQTSRTNSRNLNNDLTLAYIVFPGMTISSRFGFNNTNQSSTNLYPLKDSNPTSTLNPANRRHSFGQYDLKSWNFEPILTYDKDLTFGKLNFLLGGTFQELKGDQNLLLASGFSTDLQIQNLAAANTLSILSAGSSHYKYSAIYARLGFNNQGKYILNFTARRDGSSRFGSGNQFGDFWSAGAAYVFSKESFFPQNSFLTFGKLRTSYGVTGNDQLGDFQYLSTYSSSGQNYQGVSGITPVQHTNLEFGWETVSKWDLALELGLFKNKLDISINYYRNLTKNQLVGYPLPLYTGFPSVQANLPASIQNSGLELVLNTKILKSKNFIWSSDFNFSIPRNKLISYPDLNTSTYRNRYRLGEPLSGAFLFEYIGKNQTTSLPLFSDINGDGMIRSADDRTFTFIGQKSFLGWNNSFIIYNSFQIDVFLQYVNQNGNQFIGYAPPGIFISGGVNVPSTVVEDNSPFQVITQNFGGQAYIQNSLLYESDAIIGDASFLRVKNLSLSWTIPQTVLKKIRISSIQVYSQAQNLLTFTNYNGLDPENMVVRGIGNVPKLPPLRMITTGFRITL